MRLKATISMILVLLVSTAACAAESGLTPEENLVRSVFAATGKGLSPQDLRNQINVELQQYDNTAPQAGRLERIGQALVALKVETPEQAQAFEAQARAAAMRFENANQPSSEDVRNDLQTELGRLLAGSQGAQFSEGCGQEIALSAICAVGLGASIWGFQATHSDIVKGITAFMGLSSAMTLYELIAFQPNDCY